MLPSRNPLKRLDGQIRLWREEPMRRVQLRNMLIRPRRVRQFASFGAHSMINRPTWLYGTHKISVGEGVIILQNAWLAVDRRVWGTPGPVLEIGDRVAVRPGCSISAAESIVIEPDVLMGAYVSVVDNNHTWGESPHALYGPLETAPIHIGRGSWLADRVAVLAGSRIGEQCLIGANSVVNSEIPDFSVAVGSPARVVGSTR